MRDGILKSVLEVLAEAFIDGSFAPAKQGGKGVGKTKRGKGSKIMAVADRNGLPVAVHVGSATPHEVTLVSVTLAERFVRKAPECLIGDAAYDSDRLGTELAQCGVQLIAPHRSRRKRKPRDGRRLRRYRRRWKVERLFAWLQNFRRIVALAAEDPFSKPGPRSPALPSSATARQFQHWSACDSRALPITFCSCVRTR